MTKTEDKAAHLRTVGLLPLLSRRPRTSATQVGATLL